MTLVIGPTEAGKSTLVAEMARGLCARGLRVGIVDADLGQSEIGPPTTIGLGRAHAQLARLADAELLALHFVGATSAARNVLGTVVGVRRMLDRARALGFDRVLVDTSGLVAGDLGRALKHAKIDVVDPDLVIGLADECAHILHPYERRHRPAIVRLPPLAAPRRRSAEERRRWRAQALARHLATARLQSLDLRRVALKQPALLIGAPLTAAEVAAAERAAGCGILWAERRDVDIAVVTERRLSAVEARDVAAALGGPVASHALAEIVGMLAGVEDADGATLGIAVVRALDVTTLTLTVDTAVPADAVAVVTVGTERVDA